MLATHAQLSWKTSYCTLCMSLWNLTVCKVQYNGRPSAIFRPSDAADRSIQPLVGHLCRSIVFAAVILYYNMYYYSYYCRIVPFIINAIQSLSKPSLRRSSDAMHMRMVTSYLSANYRLWDTVNVAKKRSLQWLHKRRFPDEEKKVMYSMLIKWRRDIRYMTALLSLDCMLVVCAGGLKVEWKSVAYMQSKF